MDRLELRVDPEQYVRWQNGGGFQPVEIRINGQPLIDLVREAELPFVQKEFEKRAAEAESPEDVTLLAGDYLYLPSRLVFLPSRSLRD